MDKLKFRDLEIEDIERISELVLIKDKFKVPFLESKGINKRSLGEIFYLKYFDSFEKGLNNNSLNAKNIVFYKTLYELMSKSFSISYISNIDNEGLELVFSNTFNKSLAYLEIDNNETLTNFRLITPINNKVIVSNNLLDIEKSTNNWPLVSYHEPYLLNNKEINYLNSLDLDNEEKLLKMMNIDFNKFLKIENGEEIYGYANKLIFNGFLLNKPKSYSKRKRS